MDEGQTGDEVKLPRFSREAAMGLGNFSVNTAAVARYLEAVERELRSMSLDHGGGDPLAVHLCNPYMPLEISLAWHPLSTRLIYPQLRSRAPLRRGRREAPADSRRPICSATWVRRGRW